MTRETKVGLVVAGSFICLVAIVVATKFRAGEAAPTPSTEVADAKDTKTAVPDKKSTSKGKEVARSTKPAEGTPVIRAKHEETGAPTVTGTGRPANDTANPVSVPPPLPPGNDPPAADKEQDRVLASLRTQNPPPAEIAAPARTGSESQTGADTPPLPTPPGVVPLPPPPADPRPTLPLSGPPTLPTPATAPGGPIPLPPPPKDPRPDPIPDAPRPPLPPAAVADAPLPSPPIGSPNPSSPSVPPSPPPMGPPTSPVPLPGSGLGDPMPPSPPPIGATRPTPLPSASPMPPLGAVPPPIGSTPPMGAPSRTESNQPRVKEFAVSSYVCKPEDTSFSQISFNVYGTEKYGQALLQFNRQFQDPPRLAPGLKVRVPPIDYLQTHFASAIAGSSPPPPSTPIGPPPVDNSNPPPLGSPSTVKSGFQPASASLPPQSEYVPPIGSKPAPILVENPNPPSSPPSAGLIVGRPQPIAPPPGGRTNSGGTTSTGDGIKIYRVPDQGQHILDIAQKTLGDRGRWNEIYRLNASLQPSYPIPGGTEIRLPPSAVVPPKQ